MSRSAGAEPWPMIWLSVDQCPKAVAHQCLVIGEQLLIR